jgi:glutathione synthase/RimK-type ligase-like ATP-grasp enzyme
MKKNKLLIITSKDDAHADFFINELNSRKRSDQVIRLNTEDFAKNCVSTFNGESIQVKVIDSGLSFDSGELLSVWYRRPETISTSHVMDKEAAEFVYAQTNELLRGLYFSTHDSALWVNSLPALHRARNKLQQLKLAIQIGFKVPATIVSNDPEQILKFAQKYSAVCNKSLDQPNYTYKGQLQTYLTRVVSEADLMSVNEDSLRICPSLFQEFINKELDIRVIVIGKEVYAFEIHSQTEELSRVDFRGKAPSFLEHKPHKLSEDVKQKILQFTNSQGLFYSAIDLVYSENNEYYFLENNPNGQFLWLQLRTGVDLIARMRKAFLNH